MRGTMPKKEEPPSSNESLVRDKRYDLLAVRVKHVDARDATNSRPPTVVLEVLERFRGENRRKQLTLAWPAEASEVVLANPKKRAKWLATAYAGPAVAATFIVLVEKSGGAAISVLSRCRFPYTPEERVRVMNLAGIKKPAGEASEP